MRVTEHDVAQAERAVDRAIADRHELLTKMPTVSEGALADMRGMITRLTARRDDLRELLAEQQKHEREATKARIAAEKAVRVTELTKRLDARRDAVRDALVALEAAQRALVGACHAYNAEIHETGTELAAAGLPLVDDAEIGGDARHVVARGRQWLDVDAGVLIAWAGYRVAASMLSVEHGLAQRLARFAGTERLAGRPDAVVADTAPVQSVSKFSSAYRDRPTPVVSPVLGNYTNPRTGRTEASSNWLAIP